MRLPWPLRANKCIANFLACLLVVDRVTCVRRVDFFASHQPLQTEAVQSATATKGQPEVLGGMALQQGVWSDGRSSHRSICPNGTAYIGVALLSTFWWTIACRSSTEPTAAVEEGEHASIAVLMNPPVPRLCTHRRWVSKALGRHWPTPRLASIASSS